jgi:hypothetical protein
MAHPSPLSTPCAARRRRVKNRRLKYQSNAARPGEDYLFIFWSDHGSLRQLNRLGSPYRAGRSAQWLKVKNPAAPAVRREAEEEWQ